MRYSSFCIFIFDATRPAVADIRAAILDVFPAKSLVHGDTGHALLNLRHRLCSGDDVQVGVPLTVR